MEDKECKCGHLDSVHISDEADEFHCVGFLGCECKEFEEKVVEVNFYPDLKAHISPSAMASWVNSPGSFTSSYFAGKKSADTLSMTFGKQVHAMIEAGLLPAKKHFDWNESEISVPLDGMKEVKVLGTPDSFGSRSGDSVDFVDYKTGKKDNWSKNELASDVKMRATAWLVWRITDKPPKVHAHIEYLPVEWDEEKRELRLIPDTESTVYSYTYTGAELEEFTSFIVKTIHAVNTYYRKWKDSTADLVSEEDVAEFGLLEAEIREYEGQIANAKERQDEVKARIQAQLEFGGASGKETEFGTFFFKEDKTYAYPFNLKINYLDMGLVLEDAENIGAAANAAKSNWELHNDPAKRTRSLQFRAKKKK